MSTTPPSSERLTRLLQEVEALKQQFAEQVEMDANRPAAPTTPAPPAGTGAAARTKAAAADAASNTNGMAAARHPRHP